jgi:hypothetical protein
MCVYVHASVMMMMAVGQIKVRRREEACMSEGMYTCVCM